MANWYVRSGAGGTASGADWTNAKLTLAAALAAAAAGDDFWVSEDHAETQASTMTLTAPGTAASPNRIVCANHSGSTPPVSADLRTTATVTTTGQIAIDFGAGYAYVYGITFSAASGGSGLNCMSWRNPLAASSGWVWFYDTCTLKTTNTSTGTRFVVGTASGGGIRNCLVWLRNTVVSLGNASQSISLQSGRFVWKDTASAVGGTVPTTLFLTNNGNSFNEIRLSGLDLSAMGSGNLFNVAGSASGDILLENCRLGASAVVGTGSIAGQGAVCVRMVNCDSAATNYRYSRQTYQGTVSQETTIVRSGGASDGTTPVSRKMVSTANSKLYSPLESDPIVFWNDGTSSITVTVEMVNDGVTLTNADVWIEAEELGTASFPQGVTQSSRAADVLTTGSNLTTSSVTWTTTGLASPVKQYATLTFTPSNKGPVKVRVMLAKASQTLYFCPLVVTGSLRQWMAGEPYMNEGASSGSGGVLLNPGLTGGMTRSN